MFWFCRLVVLSFFCLALYETGDKHELFGTVIWAFTVKQVSLLKAQSMGSRHLKSMSNIKMRSLSKS